MYKDWERGGTTSHTTAKDTVDSYGKSAVGYTVCIGHLDPLTTRLVPLSLPLSLNGTLLLLQSLLLCG